jgi:hypothetical protein
MATFLSLALVSSCAKDSSTDSGADEVIALSTKDCGKGNSCKGTYSTLSSSSKVWSGVCKVRQVDSGEWTKIWFIRPMHDCGFEWIRASGDVGSDWATLAAGQGTEFMVQYTGEDIFQLRRCELGGNEDNSGCLLN